MTIHFYLKFHTHYGQTLSITGNLDVLGNEKLMASYPMAYFNDEFWHATIKVSDKEKADQLTYRYNLHNEDGTVVVEGEQDRSIDLYHAAVDEIILQDAWNSAEYTENVFYTKPFQEVLLPERADGNRSVPKSTHEFRVKAPLLDAGETICLSGTGSTFNEWDTNKPVLLSPSGKWYSVQLNLKKDKFPIEYKYGIYNLAEKKFMHFETGNNRALYAEGAKKRYYILHDGFLQVDRKWKGAGIAVPVFSLRTKNGSGVGEFKDLKLLSDWAAATGLKLIQLLPINDTSATHSIKDSYPYAAISAFALHPIYLNLEKIAGAKNGVLLKPLARKQKQLNALADVKYEDVMEFKLAALKELYEAEKGMLHEDKEYFDFFELNRKWLVPYAAFCYLRDKYNTSDFTKWKSNKIYEEEVIQQLVAPDQKHYHNIAIHYFIQYHLHLQMKDATDYAHSLGIVLKGDIPIGIYRYGCDAWMNPALYNMQEQSGAPPDDFAVKGQNWGFPTYNWDKMQLDEFAWWRNRFEQMSGYFDAFRIDHILGFFRIWSIPVIEVEGILGRFVPAIPVSLSEFSDNNTWFDHTRYCSPFINDVIVDELFSGNAELVKNKFLDVAGGGLYKLKKFVQNQSLVEQYFQKNPEEFPTLKQGLFDLVSNIIMIEAGSEQQFHFRIDASKTSSFRNLDGHTQNQLHDLYINYFFRRQEDFWRKEGMKKLPGLKRSTNMLVCGEDLGMVPACVPDVMKHLAILSLEIQRMPKDSSREFFHPRDAPYLSVVTPSTHDMSTVRGWWEEDKSKTQRFYNFIMGHYGHAPFFCESWICKEIIIQHLYSPAMWSIFQLQDILGMNAKLRRKDPDEERINQPADPGHHWIYRMHLNIEDLLKEQEFNSEIRNAVMASGR
ncbi:MAG: 4-alpha-glucanotransferase [Ginsengibacter sp.]